MLLVAVALLVAGCGGKNVSSTAPTATTTPTTTTAPAERTSFLVYTIDPADGKLVATSVSVPKTEAVASMALTTLAGIPGAKSDVPAGLHVTIANGAATVSGATLTGAAEAEVVYTLTQFPTITSVNGKTRADVERYVPAILVEHPSPDEQVTSPLHVTGNANTFEATFEYKLEDANGKILAKGFTTATSGSGARGTFDFTIPFTIDSAQNGTLVVYESSAENGAAINQREIALRLTP